MFALCDFLVSHLVVLVIWIFAWSEFLLSVLVGIVMQTFYLNVFLQYLYQVMLSVVLHEFE